MQTDRNAFESAIRAAQNGDANAEQLLIEENLPLVTAIAKRYLNRGVDFDDLKQLGSIGLLKAIRRFDVSYDVCFSTYAVPLIAGEIKRFLRDDGMIKFSRSTKQLAYAVSLALRDEPDLSVEALAKRLHVDRAELAAAAASSDSIASLNEPLSGDDGDRFDRLGVDSEEESTVQKLSLESALGALSEREQTLVHMRYHEGKTQAEVGRVFGVSQVQVSRMEKKILSRLRNRIGE